MERGKCRGERFRQGVFQETEFTRSFEKKALPVSARNDFVIWLQGTCSRGPVGCV